MEKTKWSVADLLGECPRLGVPHFQRGSVWNESNISSLLESLFFDTPCGSLILWHPQGSEPEKSGVPLVEESGEKPSLFLVDGQQRTRSLYSVFFETSESRPDDDLPNKSDIPYVWAVNLAVLEQIWRREGKAPSPWCPEKIFHTDSKTSRSLFFKIRDPRLQRINYLKKTNPNSNRKPPEYQYQYNYVPLKYFYSRECGKKIIVADKKLKIYSGQNLDLPDDNIIFVKFDNDSVCKVCVDCILDYFRVKLNEMLTKESFFVSTLNTDDMSDVIHTFIRINGGGKPVQQEEKALARLVELCPEKSNESEEEGKGTFAIIRELFNTIHPEKDKDINEQFARMKESNFGFKLFIRVFIIATNYHTGKTIGSQSMSFSVIEDSNDLQNHKNEINGIWECVKKVVLAVKDLLEDQLMFDTLAFLPDTRSLWPIFMLLIKYPDFMEEKTYKIKSDFKKHFAYILLHLFLGAGDSEKEIMQLVKVIRDSPFDGSALLALFVSGDNNIQKRKNPVPADFNHPYQNDFIENKTLNDKIFNILKIEKLKKDEDLKGFMNGTLLEDINNFMKAWNMIRDHNKFSNLKGRLSAANALTNRYILLLYVLERHLGAVDFFGEALDIKRKDNKRESESGFKGDKLQNRFGPGRTIKENIDWDSKDNSNGESNPPERQHIVPYVCLHGSDDNSALHKGRISNDKANNIGNITYISRALNHYETGIGEYWLNLAEAKKTEAQKELKKGHILSKKACGYYVKMENVPYNGDGKKFIALTGDSYTKWIEQRQKDIAVAFCSWLSELRPKSPSISDDVLPHANQIIALPQDDESSVEQEVEDSGETGEDNRKYSGDSYMSFIWQWSELESSEDKNLRRLLLAALHNKNKCYILKDQLYLLGKRIDKIPETTSGLISDLNEKLKKQEETQEKKKTKNKPGK